MRTIFHGFMMLCFIIGCQSFLPAQGALTPPGAPGPTFKTLEQIESRTPIGPDTTPGDGTSLFIISKPGSYYLTGSIIGAPAKHGIKITTDSVTLDLGGYRLQGVPGSDTGVVANNRNFITIKNGQICNWEERGISATSGLRTSVDNLTINNNGQNGADVGDNSLVTNCLVQDNGLVGVNFNFASGVVSQCIIEGNLVNGIQISGGIVTNCIVRENGGYGIFAGSGTIIESCVVSGTKNLGSAGIGSSAGNFIVRNSTIVNGENTGISCSSAIIDSCIVSGNQGTGIAVGSQSVITNNRVRGNGSHGINITGSRNRVEGNHISDHVAVGAVGLRLDPDSASNLLVRNSSVNNTQNINLGGGINDNFFGPTTSFNADADFAHPWTNFTIPYTE